MPLYGRPRPVHLASILGKHYISTNPLAPTPEPVSCWGWGWMGQAKCSDAPGGHQALWTAAKCVGERVPQPGQA